MNLAHLRPLLQTQEGLGGKSKGFLGFYFQPETFTFSNPHCGLQKASLIWWATCQGLLCTGPLPGAGKGSLPRPMTIRGSKWKHQEVAQLFQGIFSFVFIFISKTESQWGAHQHLRTSEERNWTGHDDADLTRLAGHIITSNDQEWARRHKALLLKHNWFVGLRGHWWEGKGGGGSHGTTFPDTSSWLCCSSHIKGPRPASQKSPSAASSEGILMEREAQGLRMNC